MSEPSADKRPAVMVAAAYGPATEATRTGQEAAAGQPDATRDREEPGAATMVYRKTARHKVRSRRVPGSVLTVALLAVAVFGVAAVYLVIPKSSTGRSAATAPAAGVTSTSAAKAGTTTTGGEHGQPGSLPGSAAKQGSPAKQEVAASAAPPQTGPKPLRPSDPAAISSWSAAGGKALAHVTTQSENVLAARTARNYPQMLGYCTALATAVQDAVNAPPIPDAAMQQMYTQSLNALKQGATDCMAGITEHHADPEEPDVDVNQATVDRAMSELGAGVNDLYVATSALRTM
jgi:hypothetical protein